MTSWRDPAKILAYSASDAITGHHTGRGRPAVIDITAVCDWAIWAPGQGIVEGGGTNFAAADLGHR